MPRWSSVLILVGVAGAAIAFLAYLRSPARSASAPASPGAQADTKIHVPLFVDPNLVQPTPRFRFTFDPPEALVNLRTEEGLDDVTQGAATDLERCVRLMSWTRKQWEPGIPNPYPPLDARIILKDIRRGFTGGFCAQYNYVLAQSLQAFGLPARYVSLVEHEVIEARLTDTGRWICLDPLYDAHYLDGSGRPLSVYEIHRLLREGGVVHPSGRHRIPDLKAHWQAFASFAVWLKNDHISSPLNFSDLERYKVYFLDQPAASVRIPPEALSTSEFTDIYPG